MEAAIAEIVRCSGTQFDPEVVAAVLRVVENGQLVPLPRTERWPIVRSA